MKRGEPTCAFLEELASDLHRFTGALAERLIFVFGWTKYRRPVRWLVASLAVGLSAGLIASIAYAAIPATGGLISGCVSKEGL